MGVLEREPEMNAPVFLLGATRSGTSWLQKMLGEHPAIATPQELDLLSHYVAPFEEVWQSQLPEAPEVWQRQRYQGLPSVLTASDFDALMASIVESVHERVLALKPGATIVLEKTPTYSLHLPLILRLFPDARLLHIVRDGRDVTASLLRASRGWGRTWAAATATRAAWIWRTNVEDVRVAAALTPRYLELRFEELVTAEGPELLRRALEFCGVEATSDEARAIHERYTLGVDGAPPSSIVWGGDVRERVAGEPDEPAGFYGPGRHGAWQEYLTAYERWCVEREAGALLRELGYADDDAWVSPGLWRILGPLRHGARQGYWRTRFAVGAARRELRPAAVGR
jgi:hypothetical protein